MLSYLFILLAFIIGFGLAWLLGRGRVAPEVLQEKQVLQSERDVAQAALSSAQEQNSKLEVLLTEVRNSSTEDARQISSLGSELKHARQRLEEQKAELSDLQKKFSENFQVLAQKILEEKSAKFTQTNKENIESLLKPLNEKIKDFQEKVQRTNTEGAERNSALIEQIKQLKELNHNLQSEANLLSKALRGESKSQGNWGEFQLERILNAAGLQENIHYRREENFKNEDNQNQRPDFFLDLPDGKHLILDSKVSLSAYLRYSEGEDEQKKAKALKEHMLSIHGHIDGLSKRNYQDLPGTNQPDYVMLFVANEPALMLALAEDSELFDKALQKNIVLVSTSTLLATLRTISYIWRQDAQNKNAEEIAKQAGMMYDKFHGFTEDLLSLGRQMDTARKSYDAAMNKLSEGKGNLVSRAERLKELGARKSAKQIDPRLLDQNDE